MLVVCGAAGYFVGGIFDSPTAAPEPRAVAAPAPVVEIKMPTAADSPFTAEWEKLHATHGDDPATLYAAIKDMDDGFRRRAFRSALIAEWSVRDPAAGLRYLSEKDPRQVFQFLRDWLRRDPQSAVTALLAGDDKTRTRLRDMLDDVARLAPSRLAEVVSSFKTTEANRDDTSAIDAFAIFAAKDPATARAAAESVTGDLRGQALAGVAKSWAEKDSTSALAWAQGLPAGRERDLALRSVLIGWAKADPVAALGNLDLAPPGVDETTRGSDTGSEVLREAAKKDWDGTVAWLRDHPGKLGSDCIESMREGLTHRLATDTVSTMSLIFKGVIPGLEGVFDNAVRNDGYAQRDVMWSWLDGQPPGERTNELRKSIISATAYKEPEVALGMVEKIPDTPQNKDLLQSAAASLFNGARSGNRVEGILDQAPPGLRSQLIEKALSNGEWSISIDPRYSNSAAETISSEPARWIQRLDEIPAERRAENTSRLAGIWAATDPAAAITWASTLSDSATRDRALGSIAKTWATAESREAAAWVDSIPEGKARDNAAQGLAYVLSAKEPESAWEWAASIESPAERISALKRAYVGLIRKDPAVAEQTLTDANLPAAALKDIRSYYKPGMEQDIFRR